ncbi:MULTISPECIES: TolC family protein [Pseudomonas]|uniref:Type I secretion protein TolC n=1 Tax=Pseudomonas fulva TaxID=47880 RepID=A0A0D0J1N1_9PSED|nr:MULTISPECIES: TolC family protein [Pseudomonas]KIP99375.1 type I secretion protein TolC [Pseudomonas fulva]
MTLVLAATAFLWVGQANASAAALTLPEALRLSQQNNPTLAAAGWELDISEAERRQAGLLPNPQLSWEVEDTRSDTRTTTVQLTQPIELGGKRGARVELAERGMDVAALTVEQSRNALRADVIQAFYGALQAGMRVELANESREVAQRALGIAHGRVKAGKVSPIELTRARVQLAELQLESSRATRDQGIAKARLRLVLGEEQVADTLRLQGDATRIPELPPVARLLSALASSAELRSAKLAIEQQEASFALERTQRIPDLDVSLGSQYSAADRERVNLVGLSIPLPLFNRNQGNILAAARRADQSRDQRNATELRLRNEVATSADQWLMAKEEIRSFESMILPSAQSAVESTARGFEMGKFGFLDVLDAQRTLIQSRAQYIQALSAATESWVQLERILGDVTAVE